MLEKIRTQVFFYKQRLAPHKTLVISSIGILLVVLLGAGLFLASKKGVPDDAPNIANQERFDPFVDSSEEVINCIKETIGEENYAEITKDKPRRPTQEEIKATDNCVKEFGNSDISQEIGEENNGAVEPVKPAEQEDPRWTAPKTYAQTVRQTEPLILEGNEKFTIENAHWIQTADVVLRDNAELIIRNSFFDQQKKYGDQFNLEAYGNSRVVLENMELRNECTGGLGWNFFDNSSFSANKVQQKDCNIWVLTTHAANTSINEWDWFGGTTCDDASLIVQNSKNLEIELCNKEGVDVDVDLSDSIPGEFEFSDRTFPGMTNSIILRNVTLDGWGPNTSYGTGVTIRNGVAVTTSFAIGSQQSGKIAVLDGLEKKYYDDAIWKLDEGYIHLINTTMYGWEAFADGEYNTITLTNSDFSTANAFRTSKVIVENSTFGSAKALEDGVVDITNSSNIVDITARENGRIIIRDSALGLQQGDNFYPARIVAGEDAIIELFNTPLNGATLIEEGNGRIIQR